MHLSPLGIGHLGMQQDTVAQLELSANVISNSVLNDTK